MNRTLTIIVEGDRKITYVVGGYELDEAGLAFTSNLLRSVALELERALIRKQLESEEGAPSPPEGETPVPEAER